MIFIYTDGASRGNGGESAAAYIICNGKNEMFSNVRHIGLATNNMAEYMAVHDGIEHCYLNSDIFNDPEGFTVISDSLLVMNQLKGEWRIKNKELYKMNQNVQFFIDHMDFPFKFVWKSREHPVLKRCDRMNNDCLNNL